MSNLEEFISIICGHFDNQAQYDEIQASGDSNYPLAKHVNTMCNDKISNLPTDFQDCFVLEESYYTLHNQERAEPRLFCFSEVDKGILLTSYDLPNSLDKTTLSYTTMPTIPYENLNPSAKFTPALFEKQDGVWVGGSESMFTPSLKFTLKERFSVDELVVSEVMESNGKRTFGFEPPIVYKRIH